MKVVQVFERERIRGGRGTVVGVSVQCPTPSCAGMREKRGSLETSFASFQVVSRPFHALWF